MSCESCGTESEAGQRFCSSCGHSLGTQPIDDVVTRIIDRRFVDQKFIVNETAEAIVARVQGWATLFGFALAVPAAILVLVLSVLGFNTYQDVSTKLDDAKKKAETARASAAALELQLAEGKKTLENAKTFSQDLDQLKAQLKQNRQTVDQVLQVVKTQDNAKPVASTGSTSEDQLFMAQRTNELALARSGKTFFDGQNYDAAIRFFEQAKKIETSGVWLSDYPYLAGAYLFTGKTNQFDESLNTLVKRIGEQYSYLSHKTPVGFVLNSLGELRRAIDDSELDMSRKKGAMTTVDQTIDKVTAKRDKLAD